MMGEIIQFPQRNRGRIRRSKGPASEGAMAMAQYEAYPGNVEHIDRHKFKEVAKMDLLAVAIDTLTKSLSIETRNEMRRTALITAALSEDPETRTVAALFSNAFNSSGALDSRR